MNLDFKSFLLAEMQKNDGYLTIAQFMEHALAHPKYGYYMTRDPFGAKGDFTTAPEISQMFGEMVGAWVADLWLKLGSPALFNIIECGGGRGTLLADLWRSCKNVKGFHEATSCHSIEISPVLRAMQKEKNAGTLRLHFYNSLDEIALNGPCVIIGNEFFDALPIRQVILGNEGWQERVVRYDPLKDSFAFGVVAWADHDLGCLPKKTQNGVIYEFSDSVCTVVRQCSSLIKKHGGAGLFIDYGYLRGSNGDSLQALYKHEYVSPLSHIGEADITAHVDFQKLAEVADKDGMKNVAITSQGSFLKALGIDVRAQNLMRVATHEQKLLLKSDLSRLTSDDAMGTLFKVIAFTHDENIFPAGF